MASFLNKQNSFFIFKIKVILHLIVHIYIIVRVYIIKWVIISKDLSKLFFNYFYFFIHTYININ